MTVIPGQDATIAEGRAWLQANMYDDIVSCPCCAQDVKVYKRKLSAASARVLIAMWYKAEFDWVHLPTLGVLTTGRGDECKARYWGLIEAMPDARREDGSDRVGWWRLTPLGAKFVQGKAVIQKYAVVYDSRCLELTGEDVTIVDSLGEGFNYRDLMEGR